MLNILRINFFITKKLVVNLMASFFSLSAYAVEKEEPEEFGINEESIRIQQEYEQQKKIDDEGARNHPGWQYVTNEKGLQIPIYADVVNRAKKGPTILVLHGSGGTSAIHRDWAYRLNGWGYHTVLVESFKPRGLGEIVETQSISPQERVPDVIAAATWVLNQIWSNGEIGMIGYSHGANTVFETAITNKSPIKAGIAYYPYCYAWYSHIRVPIQLHLALEDDWTPVRTCHSLYKGVSKVELLSVFEYPNAHHGFDHSRGYITKFKALTGGQLRTVTYGSNKEQAAISFEKVREFLSKQLPVGN